MSSAKKRYTEEFKLDAVNLGRDIGLNKAAKQLGIATSTLHGWVTKLELAGNNPSYKNREPSVEELQKRIKKLEKEIGYVKKINEVLKKSTAIFSNDQIPRL